MNAEATLLNAKLNLLMIGTFFCKPLQAAGMTSGTCDANYMQFLNSSVTSAQAQYDAEIKNLQSLMQSNQMDAPSTALANTLLTDELALAVANSYEQEEIQLKNEFVRLQYFQTQLATIQANIKADQADCAKGKKTSKGGKGGVKQVARGGIKSTPKPPASGKSKN